MAGEADERVLERLERIAAALERLVGPPPPVPDLGAHAAFVWHAAGNRLSEVAKVNRVDLDLLKGIDQVRDILLENTRRFAAGLPANNALLWGARGMGKSSLVKAVHAAVDGGSGRLKLIEIHREEIEALPELMALIRAQPRWNFLVFCDDLSFDAADTSYKSLKAALEGGIEGRPDNMIFYATSNRRSTAINPSEAVQEKVSLSDRFGLWLGFHHCSQTDYLAMVDAYVGHFGIPGRAAEIHAAALEWQATRGARSGRVAWQFVQDLAGRQGVRLGSR